MGKVTVIAAALITAAAAWATPPQKLVDEDFEGSWPPSGWSIDSYGANWQWGSDNGDHFAHGANTSGFQSGAYLETFKFTLTAGTSLKISFRYRGTTSSSGQNVYQRYVMLCYENNAYYTWRSPGFLDQEWGDKDFTTTAVPTTRNDYFVVFAFYVIPDPHGYCWITMDVDDVLVTINNVGVAPTTLGRVKALYH